MRAPIAYSVFGQLLLVPLAHALKFLLHLSETQAAACLTGPSEDADVLKFNFSALIVFAALVACFMTWTNKTTFLDAPRGAWHQFQGLVAARTRSSQVSMPMASSRTESKPQSTCHLPGAEAGTLAVARGTCFRQHSTSPSTDRPVW